MCKLTAAMLNKDMSRDERPQADSPSGTGLRRRRGLPTDRPSLTGERTQMTSCLDILCCRGGAIRGRRKSAMYRNFAEKARQKLNDPSLLVDRVDTVAKFLFPLMYLTLNGLYWAAYLYWIPDEIDQILTKKVDGKI